MGNELAALVDCLAQEAREGPLTLSLSLIFDLAGNNETAAVQSPRIPSSTDLDFG